MGYFAVHAPRVTYYKGGAERYVLNLLVEISKRNRKIVLVTYDSPNKTEWFLNFVNNFRGKIFLLRSNIMDQNFNKFEKASKPSLWDEESKIFGRETRQFYKKSSFDFVVCHYAVDCLHLPKGTKIYLHLHGLPDKKRSLENKAIKIPDKIIAVSRYVGDGWKKLHNFKKKIYVVHNGIFFEEIKNVKKLDIIYFGRLIKIKGVDILLKSINLLSKKGIFPSVTIIGDGPEKNNLIQLAKRLKLTHIKFLGKVTDEILFSHLASSEISVFPSYKREGIMTTLLEASKNNSTILASDSCSNKEFIKNNYNGLLFKPRDFLDLSRKIEILLFNDSLRTRLNRNSIKTLKNFTWNKQSKRIEKIYF